MSRVLPLMTRSSHPPSRDQTRPRASPSLTTTPESGSCSSPASIPFLAVAHALTSSATPWANHLMASGMVCRRRSARAGNAENRPGCARHLLPDSRCPSQTQPRSSRPVHRRLDSRLIRDTPLARSSNVLARMEKSLTAHCRRHLLLRRRGVGYALRQHDQCAAAGQSRCDVVS